jgi:hypothetical protein
MNGGVEGSGVKESQRATGLSPLWCTGQESQGDVLTGIAVTDRQVRLANIRPIRKIRPLTMKHPCEGLQGNHLSRSGVQYTCHR